MKSENKKWEGFGDFLKPKKNKYNAYYRNRVIEVEADTSYEAQGIAAKKFGAKKQYEVTVMLVEKDGEEVTHVPID